MSRYYLDEERQCENVAPTYICGAAEDRAYGAWPIPKDLVVISVGEAGAYGMLIAPKPRRGRSTLC